MRLYKDTAAKWLSRLLLAAILILVGWFSIMTIRDYGRESGAARQTLLEKGSVLIRALESGTRVGMGMRMHHAQQQTLLEEMAVQPGVLWFAVVDDHGVIITHSNSAMVGKTLYSPDVLRQLSPGEQESWRNIDMPTGTVKNTGPRNLSSVSADVWSRRHGMARCASNDGQLIPPHKPYLSLLMPAIWLRLRQESGVTP